MKIGIDARLYRSSVAGIGRYSQNLITNLLKIDPNNQYVLFMRPQDEREFRDKNIKPKNFKVRVVNIPHYSLAEQLKLPQIISREKLDLMLFLHMNVPLSYKDKFIVTIHDLTLIYYSEAAKKTNFLKQKIFYYIKKKACQNSQKIVAVSENTKRDIIKEFATADSKVKVIYEAADTLVFSPPSAAIDGLKKKYKINMPVILYVGQYRAHKNIPNLIKAFKLLKKEIPSQLVLVGKDAVSLEIEGEISKNIVRPGFVTDEELNAWYHMADVFCFPSLYEGFGLPGLEAMIAGTPVVSSDRASLPEIYEDAAIYFDPENVEDMAKKIKMVLQDKKLQAKMVEEGKIQAAKFSWEKTAEQTLKIIKEVMINHGGQYVH